MTAFWDRKESTPARHADPDGAMAEYMEQLRQAEVAGATPPAGALNGLGDAYLDKGDIVTAVDYYRQAAEVYADEGMHDNAIACCKKIRRYRPEDAAVGLMLGRYYAAKGLTADARGELDAFAGRARSGGDLERAIEALEEIVRIDPDAHAHRETLAGVYEETDREADALEAYRAALRGFESEGNPEAVERVRKRLRDLSGEQPERASEPAATTSEEAPTEEASREEAPTEPPRTLEPPREVGPAEREEVVEPASESPATDDDEEEPERPLGLGLEIERTSYVEEEPELEEEPVEELENREETRIPEPGREPDDEPSPDRDEPSTYAEMFATAGRLTREGDDEAAARWLERAASGLREEARWPEAVASYRQLATLGWADADHYEAWTECARQTGEPVKVLEALEARARWYLQEGERREARKAAEEMLLVDPDSEVASELLDRIGASPE